MSDTEEVQETTESQETAGVSEPALVGKWFDSLPEDIRSDPNITKFSDVETMSRSWLSAQQMIGRDKIPMPVTDEDWGGVYDRLGRPDTFGDYQIKAPEGVTIDADIQSTFKEIAHKAGLNQSQIQMLADFDFDRSSAGQKAASDNAVQLLETASASLKKEWGDKFDHNISISERVIDEFGGDDFRAFMDMDATSLPPGTLLKNTPQFIKMLAAVGNGMIEDNKLEGLAPSGQTPQEIKDESRALMAHPAYTDSRHPEHAAVVRKVTAMFEKMHGE